MAKVTVNIDEYGAVKVQIPKRFAKGKARAEFADTIGDTVAATMSLVHPNPGRFHMALGMDSIEP